MSREVLFELGVEELPSKAVAELGSALASGFQSALAEARLTHGVIKSFATPRRLAVLVEDLAEVQATHRVSKLGPKEPQGYDDNGKPTAALTGFVRSLGVSLDELIVVDTDKGPRFAYEADVEGLSTHIVLPEIAKQVLDALPMPKSMRWGDGGELSFVRPVHWILFLWGDEVIEIDCLGCRSARYTHGHRYHHPEAISISTPKAYESALYDAYVIADFDKRRDTIESGVKEAVKHLNASPLMPQALLDEVTSIVEWPQPLCVDFDPQFLDIPSEVLIESMQQHQKCFAVRENTGKLLPHFVTVSNVESVAVNHVIHGNARVMHARLRDAQFFYTEDKKHTLASRIDATDKVVFQIDLGSLRDKTKRMEALIKELAPRFDVSLKDASRAVQLSKSDLLTGMVGEFPELQGVMGQYYALCDGESKAVAAAIEEQYLPRFAKDKLPQSLLGVLVSLVDRLDTLVGIFGVGLKPTGEKDPFKLRRHALAIIKLLNALPVSLELTKLLQSTLQNFQQPFAQDKALVSDIKAFILERLPAFYQEQGFEVSWIRAAEAKQSECLSDLDLRLQALQHFMMRPEAKRLGAVSKRVKKLLQQANIPEGSAADYPVTEALFEGSEEKVLFDKIVSLEAFVAVQYAERAYDPILMELSSLDEATNCFFEQVMVMVDNQQQKINRLHLLARLQVLLQCVVDVSLLSQGSA